jgi:hypothetical protein
MTFHVKIVLKAMVALLLSASAASAVPVGTGAGITPGNPETNWNVTSGDVLQALGVVNPYGSAWVDPSAAGLDVNWISPRFSGADAINDTDAASTDVDYIYSLTFDDPNMDLHVAWASDNNAQFYLNEILPANLVSSTGDKGYESLTTFAILADAFAAGSNTFSVVVTNLAQSSGNPTGLLVSISTPLPPALLLFGSGLAGLGWLSRRRRRRAQRAAEAS